MNISIIGNGFIASALIDTINECNKREEVEQININNILVRNPSRYKNVPDNMTTDLEDILQNESDIVIDLSNNIDFSLEALPKIAAAGKSIMVLGKVFLAEHGKFIFNLEKQYGIKVSIGACVSSDLPINISDSNPLRYPGRNYVEKRGNSSDQVCTAIFEELIHFYNK
jgi:homoserine dehydrogenase